jgi:hypothetical protein
VRAEFPRRQAARPTLFRTLDTYKVVATFEQRIEKKDKKVFVAIEWE